MARFLGDILELSQPHRHCSSRFAVWAGGAEFVVNDPAVLHRETCGLAGQDGGLPLGEQTRLHQRVGVGHLRDQDLREPEELGALLGRDPPRERNLGSNPFAKPPDRNPGLGLAGPNGFLETYRRFGLDSLSSALDRFETRDPVDQLSLGRTRRRPCEEVVDGLVHVPYYMRQSTMKRLI
ncbi:hypothetical protein AB0F44_09655 [Nocardioides sp. NPDC023903]|uniref:hypothetical protein n=1 Tax=Nocardioides sp. NPDC023903 TaxID=3157195 RepID=UPI0033C1C854